MADTPPAQPRAGVYYRTKHGPIAEYVVDESEGSDREGVGPWSVYMFSLDRHTPQDEHPEWWVRDVAGPISSVDMSEEDFWRAMSCPDEQACVPYLDPLPCSEGFVWAFW